MKVHARVLHVIGDDSERAARVATVAQAQSRLWPFLEAFFASQGAENSGYVTDSFLRAVAEASGVDATRALAYAKTDAAQSRLDTADADASKLGVSVTPTFVVTLKNAAPRLTSARGVRAAIEAALAR